MDAGIQRRDQRGKDVWRQSGTADCKHGGARHHRGAHDVGRQQVAHRAAAAIQQLPLEGACIPLDIRPEIGAETRVQTIDALARRRCVVKHRTRPPKPLYHQRRDLKLSPVTGDRRDVANRKAGSGEDDRCHANRSLWPMHFARALASIADPSAMSESDRPRCQNRIVSSSLSRPGLSPATI